MFKDTHENGFHVEIMNESNIKCLYITSIVYGKMIAVEKLSYFSFGLNYSNIKYIKSYVVVNQKFDNPKIFHWHDKFHQLGLQ